MDNQKQPTYGNGKICYLMIPATNPEASARFYKECFDWNIRKRDDGSISFDDTVTEISGMWTTSRQPFTQDGLGILIYIMVFDIATTINKITANGGKIVQPVGMDAPEITASFSDPVGNVFGLYQERG